MLSHGGLPQAEDVDAPLFDAVRPAADRTHLPTIAPPQKVRHDYRATGFSLRAHPLSFLRGILERRGVLPAALLKDPSKLPNHAPVTVAGL